MVNVLNLDKNSQNALNPDLQDMQCVRICMTTEKNCSIPNAIDAKAVCKYLLDNSRKICGSLSWIWERAVQHNDAFSTCLDNINSIAQCIHLTLYLLQQLLWMSIESV